MRTLQRLLVGTAVLLLALAGRATAQYMYLDSNNDGVWTSDDRMAPVGTVTTVGVWLDPTRNRDGSPAQCPTSGGPLADINSYVVNLRASQGVVSYGDFTNALATFLTAFGEIRTDTEYMTGFGGSAYLSIGAPVLLGTLTITAQSGAPEISIVSAVAGSEDLTSFGTKCASVDFDNTYQLSDAANPGEDWTDVDGLGPPPGGPCSGNHPPILTVPATATAVAGTTFTLPVMATDMDPLDTITLSAGTLPDGAVFSQTGATTGTMTWTPGACGSFTIDFTAEDNCGARTTRSVVLLVTPSTAARKISGIVFRDDAPTASGSCVMEGSDAGVAKQQVELRLSPGGPVMAVSLKTPQSGAYDIQNDLQGNPLAPNVYYASLASQPNWSMTCPVPYHVVDLTCVATAANINFGTVCDGLPDLAIVSQAVTKKTKQTLRPGEAVTLTFETTNWSCRGPASLPRIVFRVEGRATITALDHLAQVVPNDPAWPACYWETGKTTCPAGPPGDNQQITWLGAGLIGTFEVSCMVNADADPNDPITAYVTIYPTAGDAKVKNNYSFRWSGKVGDSKDPNVKSVMPEGRILREDPLTYVVEFQNTGNDVARTVVVRDLLDTRLDPTTVDEMITSHPCTVAAYGQEIVWTFEGIDLPDSTSNEPESHGSIVFTVMPRASAPDGTTIENHASIYFDLNEPIVTNSTFNVIDSPPAFAPPAEVTVEAGQVLDVPLSATDPENDPIAFTLLSGPAWASVSSSGGSTGSLHLAPPPAEAGTTADAVIEASDGLLSTSATVRIHVTCSTAMEFDLTPNALNLRSLGRWVTGYLEPPPPLTVADIDTPSIRLNGVVPVDPEGPVETGDHDRDGIPDLAVKFDRAAVDLTLTPGDDVEVVVTGLVAGQCFRGTDRIRVLRGLVSAPVGGSTLAAGSTATVRWVTPAGIQVQSVALLSSTDGGESWSLDASGLPNTGSAAWVVPAVPTDRGRVAIVLVESSDETGYVVDGVLGTSDTFSIGSITGVDAGGRAEFALRRVPSNPSQQALRVEFSLPDSRPAKLEVFDVVGRLVAARDVGNLGAGPHTVTLGESTRLASGVYIVRLSQGGRSLTARAVVVR